MAHRSRSLALRTWVWAICVMFSLGQPVSATDGQWGLQGDWVATDVLGRKLPGYAECGPPRTGRTVGIFYFLWLGEHGAGGPYDITKLLAANPTNPAWGPVGAFHHWGESEMGYYLSSEEYVIRAHCRMLVNAGIDVVVFDVTNGFPYTSNYLKVCDVYSKMRAEGATTPQICFLVNPDNNGLVPTIYDELYSKNLYPELWFRWLGKPLILTRPDGLNSTLRDFFTFRRCWAWSAGRDNWTWLDSYPQKYGYHVEGTPEEISVSVAQHPTSNIGRSFHSGQEPAVNQYGTCPTTDQGLCFAQQWSRALQVDPPFIFITGWNEWVAQRFVSDGNTSFLGKKLPKGGTFFVDEYNQEYSRDIEPMKDGHTDDYYYQMIANIRRYKGMKPPTPPSGEKTIRMDGDFSDWSGVLPEYRDWVGDTEHRDSAGWGSAGTYVNNTGRNDFVRAKVARDKRNVYFYIETKDPITPHTDPNWMLSFIDSDRNAATGWHGYDYLVNYPPLNSTTTTVKRNLGGWKWGDARRVPYRVAGNRMEIAIPRSLIGQTASRGVAFDFHWADNIRDNGDISEFFTSGDSAPDRRFNYRYATTLRAGK